MGTDPEEQIVLLINWTDECGDCWIFSISDMARADAKLAEVQSEYRDVRINARWESNRDD